MRVGRHGCERIKDVSDQSSLRSYGEGERERVCVCVCVCVIESA